MDLKGRNLFCLYPQMLEAIYTEGKSAAPRNKPVQELTSPSMWSIECPHEWALLIPGRKLNPFFALAEVVWMWSGKGGAEFISFYNKSISQFLDKGIPYFHGSYGRRVRHAGYNEQPFRSIPCLRLAGTEAGEVEIDQLEHVISKLQFDPETRQAVVSLWDPTKDNLVQSKDHPCNNMIYFWLREGKLNMTVIRRSNDLIWGVPYNMIQFAHLQALVAGSLGVGVGAYHVVANNLHLYENLYDATLTTVKSWKDQVDHHGIDLNDMSDIAYKPGWNMTWDLRSFDRFVSAEWDTFEKQSRMFIDQQIPGIYEHHGQSDTAQNTIEAFYQTRLMHLNAAATEHAVPQYWVHLFSTLMAYHCRKAEAMGTYNTILATLPLALRWLIKDFTQESTNVN